MQSNNNMPQGKILPRFFTLASCLSVPTQMSLISSLLAQNVPDILFICTKCPWYLVYLHKMSLMSCLSAQNVPDILCICTKCPWCLVYMHKMSLISCFSIKHSCPSCSSVVCACVWAGVIPALIPSVNIVYMETNDTITGTNTQDLYWPTICPLAPLKPMV